MKDSPNRDVEIFTEALRLPQAERVAYLELACGSDTSLRRRVEALLTAHKEVGDFLEDSPQTFSTAARPGSSAGEKPGDRIGRYKLLEEIGEGGCGVVFVAEQAEPVRRLVALKIIKPGMDTKSVIARFEAERQALALMDHPNIAKVFDAGATDSGRPYFVMEFIRGIKITQFCNQHSLTTKDRLILFAQVCEAVQHAHQKGIIHRDIKPSNILVTTTEQGASLPVVIDFGIAKAATNQQLTDKTFFTAFEMLIGTPAYMSPEQATLSSGAEVDTRTDVYSLGVLLYELLTGSTPFDAAELLKAGIDEIRRVIREQEPARPSTRLSTMAAETLTHEARHRQTNAPTLIRAIRGDLDWIAMKAMEKDRARRYATAHGLALDVQRYLANEAVSACPPSAFYKFRKLVRRNKLLFAGIVLIAGLVIASLIVVSISLSKEREAHHDAELSEQKALTQAARSQQVTKLLQNTLSGIDPTIALGRDTTLLREILDKAVKNMDLELTNQPAVLADLRMTIGSVYGALLQPNKAEPMIRDALDFYRKTPAGAEQQISDALSGLSRLHLRQPDKLEEAEREAREALDWESKTQGGSGVRLVELRSLLAWVLVKRGRAADAERMFRDALVAEQRLSGDHPEQLLDIRAGLATALNLQDKFDESEKLLRESISIGQQKFGTDHPYVINDIFRLGYVLERQHKFEEAEKYDRQCLALRRKVLGVDHPLNDEALQALTRVLFNENKATEAADVYGELLDARRKRLGDQDPSVMETVNTLARLLTATENETKFQQLAGQFSEAWAGRAEVLARSRHWPEARLAASNLVQLRPGDHMAYHTLAPLLAQIGDRVEYEELCQKIASRFAGATNPYNANIMAKDCLILPRPGADLKVPAELAETAVTVGGSESRDLAVFQCCKALAEYRQGHWDAASDWAVKSAKKAVPWSQAQAAAILAMSQFKLNRLDNARTAFADCDKIIEEKQPAPEHDLDGNWREWIIAYTLCDEAKRLIEGDSRIDKNSPQK